MKTWIVLFRGINVGGKNILRMKELAVLLTDSGYKNVKTYIQSGNVVMQSRRATARSVNAHIRKIISESHGLRPAVISLQPADLEQAVSANPFPAAQENPRSLHLYFLASAPEHPDLEAMEAIKAPGETFVLSGKVFYLHARDGMAWSRLGAKTEDLLGVEATARNWRTVNKILAMARELQ